MNPLQNGWHLKGLDPSNLALPVAWNNGKFAPFCQFTFPDYPDGGFRASAIGVSKHLQMFMNSGVYNGTRILNASTVREMKNNTRQEHQNRGAEGYRQVLALILLVPHIPNDPNNHKLE